MVFLHMAVYVSLTRGQVFLADVSLLCDTLSHFFEDASTRDTTIAMIIPTREYNIPWEKCRTWGHRYARYVSNILQNHKGLIV